MKLETLQQIAKQLSLLHKIVSSYNEFTNVGTLEEYKETCFSNITGTTTMEVCLQNLITLDGYKTKEYEEKLRKCEYFFTHLVQHSGGNHFQQFVLSDFTSIVDGNRMSEDIDEETILTQIDDDFWGRNAD